MSKVFLSDFVDLQDNVKVVEQLAKWQKCYPASPFINIFCLKLSGSRTFVKNRPKLLSTIVDRKIFRDLSVQAAPVIDFQKDVIPPHSISDLTGKEKSTEHPIFVKQKDCIADDKREMIDSLIAKFSEDVPKIIYSPEKHDADANYGEASLGEDPDIASETLANIYAAQGCIGKAIHMFEILQLHFPEKSCYFAAQIEKLKKKRVNK